MAVAVVLPWQPDALSQSPLCDHAEQFCTRQQAFSPPVLPQRAADGIPSTAPVKTTVSSEMISSQPRDTGMPAFLSIERNGPSAASLPRYTDAVARSEGRASALMLTPPIPIKIDAAREEFGKHTPSYAAAPKNGATHERQRPANGSARPLRSMKKHGGKAVFFRSRISI